MRVEGEVRKSYGSGKCKALQKQMYCMGVNGSYRGFGFAVDMAFQLEKREGTEVCMKEVFIDVARNNHTSHENVKRDIRYLIRVIWNCGDREALEELAGRNLEKPPTCREFIWMLVDYIKRRGFYA